MISDEKVPYRGRSRLRLCGFRRLSQRDRGLQPAVELRLFPISCPTDFGTAGQLPRTVSQRQSYQLNGSFSKDIVQYDTNIRLMDNGNGTEKVRRP